MPASAAPPSLALKNLICVAFGLPRTIVQATIVPSRGTRMSLLAEPTLAWKPVVRLTARQGVPGQLGTVAGEVAPITPTSLSVAGEVAGRTSASAKLAQIAVDMRLIDDIQHDYRVRSRGLTISLPVRQFLRRGCDLLRIARRRDPGKAQRVVLVARNHVDVEVEDALPGHLPAGVHEIHPVGSQTLVGASCEPLGGDRHGLQVLRLDAQEVGRVRAWYHERMPAVGGVDVHEGDRPLVFVDDRRGNLIREDLAEEAIRVGHRRKPRCSAPARAHRRAPARAWRPRPRTAPR